MFPAPEFWPPGHARPHRLQSRKHCSCPRIAACFLTGRRLASRNPLITFEYLREHMDGAAPSRNQQPIERLTAAYVRPWMSFYSPDDLRRALAVSPLIAVFVYAIASDAWRAPDSIPNPALAGYFRSLDAAHVPRGRTCGGKERTVPGLASAPPFSPVEPVTEILHGVPIMDPYRWLEDQDSPRTRQWIEEQTRYARGYLDHIPGRENIRKRIREFLAVETYDSLQKVGNRYFFRKRLPDQEQPCIYMREGADGEDQLLVDPAEHGAGKYTAVKPLRVSPDGRLLLFEVKEGGERTGTFKLLDIESRGTLPDVLSRGYLRGFAFAPDGKSFCYVHEPLDSKRPFYRAAHHHILGTNFNEDREIFCAGEDEKLRLCLVADATRLGFLVYRFLEKTRTDFYLKPWESDEAPARIVTNADYSFGPLLLRAESWPSPIATRPICGSWNCGPGPRESLSGSIWFPKATAAFSNGPLPESGSLSPISGRLTMQVSIFDLAGNQTGEMPVCTGKTVRITGASPENDELFLESESFAEPVAIHRYSPGEGKRIPWAKKSVPFDSARYEHIQVRYASKDGTEIPMFLVGRRMCSRAAAIRRS